jgi:hypothetical protein
LTCEDGAVHFVDAEFSGSTVTFGGAVFAVDAELPGKRRFDTVGFPGSTVHYIGTGHPGFDEKARFYPGAKFSSGEVSFGGMLEQTFAEALDTTTGVVFSGGTVTFEEAEFSGATVTFEGAKFSADGVHFEGAEFSGGQVDFSKVDDWSHPPVFGWSGAPPAVVLLPEETGHSVS